MGRHMRIAVMMVVALASGVAAAAGATKYSTPAEVLAAYEKAHDAGDDAAGIDCLSVEGQEKSLQFILGMELATRQPEPGAPAPSAEEKKARAEMDALLAKHGIKDLTPRPGEDTEALVKRITAHVTDRRTLLIDLMKMLAEPGAKPSPCRKGEVQDLKVAGDDATGKYVVKEPDNSQSSQDLKFKKVDGSWLLADMVMLVGSDAPDPAAAGAAKPAKP